MSGRSLFGLCYKSVSQKILVKCHLVPNILLDAGNEGKLCTQRPYTLGV